MLTEPEYGVVVVEHRDRLARFGSESVEAALAALGRRRVAADPDEVFAADPDEVKDDLAPDMTA